MNYFTINTKNTPTETASNTNSSDIIFTIQKSLFTKKYLFKAYNSQSKLNTSLHILWLYATFCSFCIRDIHNKILIRT